MIVDITILKILSNSIFCKNKKLFFFNKYKKIKTPIHVDIDVAIGIIKNPKVLKKLKLIITFKQTINEEM